ncbi:hypothetical protein [Tenacibaculum singaporense]|uniref:Yip1 domain-containing protein n=1 Tax=Tenacibaculum singaporense TaxID=2358479 RepID=A0A3S8R761_9FLAO|nr:hypothetical protein [Tenacibaculum singaporense]AZJ35577.1 hypothetical protein D6T69_08590 [Tenacibaculum singaporense]
MKKLLFQVLLLLFTFFFLTFLYNETLNTDSLLINSFSDQLTNQQLIDLLNFKEKWEWLGYLSFPFILLLKLLIISAILDVGCFFFEKNIKFNKLFDIVIKSEYIFLLVILVKTFWFYFFVKNFSINDLEYFYPLSILNIIDYEEIQPWFIYPLQVVNLFELAYWIILTYFIGKELNTSFNKSFYIVASSYGISLLIWVIFIMFLTLNMI